MKKYLLAILIISTLISANVNIFPTYATIKHKIIGYSIEKQKDAKIAFMQRSIENEPKWLAIDKNKNKIHDELDKILKLVNDDDEIEIVVLLKGDETEALQYFTQLGGRINKVFKKAIHGFSGKIKAKMIPQLAREDSIELIQPNIIHRITTYNSLRLMNVKPIVWSNYGLFGPTNMSIAILDSGIDPTHIMLGPYYGNGNFSGKIIGWYDAVNGKAKPYDDNGHGTSVASIVAGKFYNISPLALQFSQFAIVIDGLEEGDHLFFITDVFPVFVAGNVTITVKWKDISVRTSSVSGHRAKVTGFTIYTPKGKTFSTTEEANPLTLTFYADSLGIYSIEIDFLLTSGGNDPDDPDGPGIAYWAYAHLNVSSSDNYSPFAGISPEAKIVGVKVLDKTGTGETEEIIDGIEWVINNKETYRIVAATITFGSPVIDVALEEAVNNLINNGIVVVCAAGNEGPERSTINSPARIDYVITVAASTDGWRRLNITNWSSRGPYGRRADGSEAITNTIKPDIAAPGGAFDEPAIICADSNQDDNLDVYIWNYQTGYYEYLERMHGVSDINLNDLTICRGTSISTAHVGGAVMLLIQALTQNDWSKWNYTLEDVLKVKQLLLMTAWEFYRGREVKYKRNRGEKDIVEGYGLIQLDAAIECLLNEIEVGQRITGTFSASIFGKHVWGGKVKLDAGINYIFRLTVPEDADFDLYLWDENPDPWGQPVLIARGTHGRGHDEYFVFSPSKSGYYYLTVKQISGAGEFELNIYPVEHEEVKKISITPSSGSIVDKTKVEMEIEVEVDKTYVTNVSFIIGETNYSLVCMWVSKDGRVSIWGGNVSLKVPSTEARILIETPIEIFEIEYSLIVIPYFPLVITGVALAIAVPLSWKIYGIYKKRKLERLKRIEEEAKKLAEELLEESEGE